MRVSKFFTVLLVIITVFAIVPNHGLANESIKEQHQKNLMVVKSQLWHDGIEIIDARLGEQQGSVESEESVEVVKAYPEELTIPMMKLQ
jgi:hypothetical protein